jgi:hypothetical protein
MPTSLESSRPILANVSRRLCVSTTGFKHNLWLSRYLPGRSLCVSEPLRTFHLHSPLLCHTPTTSPNTTQHSTFHHTTPHHTTSPSPCRQKHTLKHLLTQRTRSHRATAHPQECRLTAPHPPSHPPLRPRTFPKPRPPPATPRRTTSSHGTRASSASRISVLCSKDTP